MRIPEKGMDENRQKQPRYRIRLSRQVNGMKTILPAIFLLNLTASAFPAACPGVSERIPMSSFLQIEDSPPKIWRAGPPLAVGSLHLGVVASVQGSSGRITPRYAFNVGFSRVSVDPDVDINLNGTTGEIRWFFGRKKLDRLSRGLSQVHELTFSATHVFTGKISTTAFGLSYGRRYEFPSCYLGFGIGPFTYWLSSNQKTDPLSGYTLDTGLRLHVLYLAGLKIPVKTVVLTLGFQYDFTIRHLYLHNPLKPHKHEDIFHYWTFNIGFMK